MKYTEIILRLDFYAQIVLFLKGVHEIASLSCSTFDHAKVEKK